jgi:hypothetical protein
MLVFQFFLQQKLRLLMDSHQCIPPGAFRADTGARITHRIKCIINHGRRWQSAKCATDTNGLSLDNATDLTALFYVSQSGQGELGNKSQKQWRCGSEHNKSSVWLRSEEACQDRPRRKRADSQVRCLISALLTIYHLTLIYYCISTKPHPSD